MRPFHLKRQARTKCVLSKDVPDMPGEKDSREKREKAMLRHLNRIRLSRELRMALSAEQTLQRVRDDRACQRTRACSWFFFSRGKGERLTALEGRVSSRAGQVDGEERQGCARGPGTAAAGVVGRSEGEGLFRRAEESRAAQPARESHTPGRGEPERSGGAICSHVSSRCASNECFHEAIFSH